MKQHLSSDSAGSATDDLAARARAVLANGCRAYAVVHDSGADVIVTHDRDGYWKASAPGFGAMSYGSSRATMDMTVRDAVRRWERNGRPPGVYTNDMGWTRISVDELCEVARLLAEGGA